jgi:hypothetical protein
MRPPAGSASGADASGARGCVDQQRVQSSAHADVPGLPHGKEVCRLRPFAVVDMPSPRYPTLVRSVAEHIATVGRLPLVNALTISGLPPTPQHQHYRGPVPSYEKPR